MQIDTIVLVAFLTGALIVGCVAWFLLRRSLPTGAAEELALAVAYVKSMLVGVVTETEVQAFAGWVYDNLKTGSAYYSREQFVDLVTRTIMRALENERSVTQLATQDSALATRVKSLRQPA